MGLSIWWRGAGQKVRQPLPPEDNETPGMQSGPHWEGQNGLPASSVSAWCGVAGDGGRVGGEFLGSARGLWVVSCGQFGFLERRPICPENAGARWKKRTIVPHRHHPVLLLRPGRPAVPLQRAHFAGGAVVACHFLATAYQRQGTAGVSKKRRSNRQGSNQWACWVHMF